MKWDFVYEEKLPDVNGYCSRGVIANGKRCLFFSVSHNESDGMETCRVYSSITFSQESLECQYLWSAENDEMLIDCLNGLKEGEPYCGASSPIKDLHFFSDREL